MIIKHTGVLVMIMMMNMVISKIITLMKIIFLLCFVVGSDSIDEAVDY